MKIRNGLLFAGLLTMAQSSWALQNFDLSAIQAQAQPVFAALSEDLTSALSYKAISPAEPLGLLGFDVGLELSATSLSSVDTWGSVIGSTNISVLPLPKLHVHKGLPMNMDVGVVYSKVPSTNISYMGGEFRYSVISGGITIPAVAVRGAFTKLMGVDDISLSTRSLELTVSKGFLMLTPYAGLGQVWGTSEPGSNFSALFKTENISQTKLFGGVNLNMGLINFAFEADKTGDSASYSAKLGFRF